MRPDILQAIESFLKQSVKQRRIYARRIPSGSAFRSQPLDVW
jgi:hypothetical protein